MADWTQRKVVELGGGDVFEYDGKTYEVFDTMFGGLYKTTIRCWDVNGPVNQHGTSAVLLTLNDETVVNSKF